jgi:hypothetical protein
VVCAYRCWRDLSHWIAYQPRAAAREEYLVNFPGRSGINETPERVWGGRRAREQAQPSQAKEPGGT